MRMPRLRGAGSVPAVPTGLSAMRKLIRRCRPDIVHSNTVRAHLISVVAARSCRVPVVWTIRDFTFPIGLYRLLVRWVDRVIFVSGAIEQVYGTRETAGKCSVVLNGILIPKIDVEAERKKVRTQLNIPEKAPLVLSVGQLVPQKGQDRFLMAASRVAKQIPSAYFLIVGDGSDDDYRARLAELAAQEELGNRVIFTGYRSDVISITCAADVSVHSAVEPEAFGRVLVEAMALGVPLIASPYGGPAEIIQEGVCGLLVDPQGTDRLADAIVAVLSDEALATKLSVGGRAKFEQCFEQTRETEAIQGIYDGLLRLRSGRTKPHE